jgi:hypothetical protein
MNYQLDPGLVAENSCSRSGSGSATLAPRNSNFIYARSRNPAEIILFSFKSMEKLGLFYDPDESSHMRNVEF